MANKNKEMKNYNKQFLELIKRSNYYYDKKFDIYKKLENDGLLTLNEKCEVILNWNDANPHQQWMMRRYKDYVQYYEQLQTILKDMNG